MVESIDIISIAASPSLPRPHLRVLTKCNFRDRPRKCAQQMPSVQQQQYQLLGDLPF